MGHQPEQVSGEGTGLWGSRRAPGPPRTHVAPGGKEQSSVQAASWRPVGAPGHHRCIFLFLAERGHEGVLALSCQGWVSPQLSVLLPKSSLCGSVGTAPALLKGHCPQCISSAGSTTCPRFATWPGGDPPGEGAGGKRRGKPAGLPFPGHVPIVPTAQQPCSPQAVLFCEG